MGKEIAVFRNRGKKKETGHGLERKFIAGIKDLLV